MENLELRKAVFEKMGFHQIGVVWLPPKSFHIQWTDSKSLPPIETTWEVTAKYLVTFMRGKGWDYGIAKIIEAADESTIGDRYFGWGRFERCSGYDAQGQKIRSEPMFIIDDKTETKIIKDDLAFAACKAFMEAEL